MTTTQAPFSPPAHVPAELVRAYDHVNGPEIMAFPPTAVQEFGSDKPVFYSCFHGGFWVLTNYEDIRTAFLDAELFPQWGRGIPVIPFDRVFIPLNLDPPDHRPYRKLMTPLFSPGRVAKLEPVVREVARARIAELAAQQGCEVVGDFALVLPGANFCAMLGLPVSEFPSFNKRAMQLIYEPAAVRKEYGDEAATAIQKDASAEIEAFIGSLVEKRRSEPGDDIISYLLQAKVDGRPLTCDEVHNITNLLFFAGTDSTGAMMAYAFAFLAEHAQHRQYVIDHPDEVEKVVDELIRFHGFHHITRVASRDVEFGGVQMKKGDLLVLPTGGANHDPQEFATPDNVDFGRSNASHHLSFGAGIHRCLGAPLARLMMRIALEEFHKVIPDYSLAPEGVAYVSGRSKTIPETVHLKFDRVVAP